MPTPAIIRGSDFMFTTTYEGNGGGQKVGKFIPFTDNGTIANSVIFNRGDNPKLSRLPSSDGNRRTLTYSVWIKRGILGTENHFISCYDGSSSDNESMWEMQFLTDNTVSISRYSDYILQTTRTFEDTSKWYHFLMAIDTTQGTGSDRVKLYVDGDEITAFDVDNRSSISQNFDTAFNNTSDTCVIGARINTTNRHWSGYMAEVNLVDGTAYGPSTFGLTDTSTGRWIPKTLTGISYGTNGFRLQFGDSSALGDDTSGNTNDFTATNLASTDQTTDSPTQNHITFDPLRSSDWTFTEGNLQCEGTPTSGAGRHSFSNMILPKSGKYYFEMTVDVNNDSPRWFGLVKADSSVTEGTYANLLPRVVVPRNGGTSDGHFISDGQTSSANGFSTTAGSVINFALDATNEKLYVGKDGNYYGFEGAAANPANGTNPTFSNIYKTIDWVVANLSYSTGLSSIDHKVTWNFGGKSFTYTPPTGFVALQQDNLPENSRGISDFVWIKNRDSTDSHQLYDSSRGKQKDLHSNSTGTESTTTDGLQKFLKGGCQIEDDVSINTSGESYVAWNWVANGGTTTANTDGSGATIASTNQVNQTAGFSIIQYTGTSTNGTLDHGLSSAPDLVILKNLDQSSAGSGDWMIWHKALAATEYLSFDGDAKATLATAWNSTSPTNKVISVGTATRTNNSNNDHIIYAWHEVEGFSKFGTYEGNNNTNGPFVFTGFKPALLILKNIDSASRHWVNYDTGRDPINPLFRRLYWNLTNTQGTSGTDVDFLSNGFKLRRTGSDMNESAKTIAYIAFAEHPFVGNGTNPVTAR